MIRHVVFCRFRKDVSAKQIADIEAALKALRGTIPGIVAITFGADNSPEGLQRGATHGFSVDFTDAAARDAYLPHPAHVAVGKMIVGACQGGVDGVAVVDWPV